MYYQYINMQGYVFTIKIFEFLQYDHLGSSSSSFGDNVVSGQSASFLFVSRLNASSDCPFHGIQMGFGIIWQGELGSSGQNGGRGLGRAGVRTTFIVVIRYKRVREMYPIRICGF